MDKELLSALMVEARKEQNEYNVINYKAGNAPMEASVGGIVFQSIAGAGEKDMAKTRPLIFSNPIDCPPENDIRDKKFNALELVMKAHTSNMANAVGAIDIIKKEGLIPATILAHEEVDPEAVLNQCMDNYRQAERLPGRKPSEDKKSTGYRAI